MQRKQGVSDDTVNDAGNMSQSTLDVEPSVEENPQDSTIVDDLEASLYMTGGLVPYCASSDSSDTIEYSPCTLPTSLLDAHQSNEDIMAEQKENKPRTSLTRKGILMKCKLEMIKKQKLKFDQDAFLFLSIEPSSHWCELCCDHLYASLNDFVLQCQFCGRKSVNANFDLDAFVILHGTHNVLLHHWCHFCCEHIFDNNFDYDSSRCKYKVCTLCGKIVVLEYPETHCVRYVHFDKSCIKSYIKTPKVKCVRNTDIFSVDECTYCHEAHTHDCVQCEEFVCMFCYTDITLPSLCVNLLPILDCDDNVTTTLIGTKSDYYCDISTSQSCSTDESTFVWDNLLEYSGTTNELKYTDLICMQKVENFYVIDAILYEVCKCSTIRSSGQCVL